MNFVARPIFGLIAVTAVLWVLANSFSDFDVAVPADAPALDAEWDPSADVVFSTLLRCLHDVSYVSGSRAIALHAPTGVLNIEHWYRDRCRSMLDDDRFRLFSRAYGVRATAAVRRIVDREAGLVVLAIDDPTVGDADVVAYWRAAAGRAAADLDHFRRTLRAFYEASDADSPAPSEYLDLPPTDLSPELPPAAPPLR